MEKRAQRPAHRLQPIGTGETLVLGDDPNDSTAADGSAGVPPREVSDGTEVPAPEVACVNCGADLADDGRCQPCERAAFVAAMARDNERRTADDLAVTVRNLSPVELLDWRGRLQGDVVEPGYADAETDALARLIATAQLSAVEAELARRERVSQFATTVASPSDGANTAWADVARELRDTVPVPKALERMGHPMRRVGRDREGREEHAGACPWCGGEDRFRAWGAPRSRWWCRRCEARGDVVTLWRNATALSFVDACRDLAVFAGLSAPDGEVPPAVSGPPLRRPGPKRITSATIVAGKLVPR